MLKFRAGDDVWIKSLSVRGWVVATRPGETTPYLVEYILPTMADGELRETGDHSEDDLSYPRIGRKDRPRGE